MVSLGDRPDAAAPVSAETRDRKLTTALDHLSVKDAAAVVAGETGLPRREVYGRAVALAAGRRERG